MGDEPDFDFDYSVKKAQMLNEYVESKMKLVDLYRERLQKMTGEFDSFKIDSFWFHLYYFYSIGMLNYLISSFSNQIQNKNYWNLDDGIVAEQDFRITVFWKSKGRVCFFKAGIGDQK